MPFSSGDRAVIGCSDSWPKPGQIHGVKMSEMSCKQVVCTKSELLAATLIVFAAFCARIVEMPPRNHFLLALSF